MPMLKASTVIAPEFSRYNPLNPSRVLFCATLGFVVCGSGFGVSPVLAGSAQSWGGNTYGELGNGTTSDSSSPVAVNGLGSGVTAITSSGSFSVGVQNGAAYAWGSNFVGALGSGDSMNHASPVAVSGLSSGVTAVVSGGLHTLAIRNGSIYAWGTDYSGQLGDGQSGIYITTPVQTSGLNNVNLVAAGTFHSLAVQNGVVYAWGDNRYGELGNGTTTNSSLPIPVPTLSSGVTAIAAGYYNSFAVKNGAVYAWGMNVDPNGGFRNDTTPVAVPNLSSGVTAVAGGNIHNLAVKNGGVYSWGYGASGALGTGTSSGFDPTPVQVDPADVKNITAVAAGLDSSYALSSDGSIWTWGDNSRGQLGLGTAIQEYDTPQHLLAPTGYAYTSIASEALSYHAVATLEAISSFGDLNGDLKVDVVDLGILASHWQATGTNVPGDINGDGIVNVVDLGTLASHWQFGTTASGISFADALKQFDLTQTPEPTVSGFVLFAATALRRKSRRA